MTRAYTHVAHGQARLGNRWLERVWSGYMGHTTSLVQKATDLEWVAANNPEFAFAIGGESFGPGALGEIEWSEECNDLGATLVATHHGTAIEVRVEQMALHDFPALVRTMILRNPTSQAVDVGPITTESLAMEGAETRFSVGDLTTLADSAEYAGKDAVGALVLDGIGLLFLNKGHGGINLGFAEPGVCSALESERRVLGPLEQVALAQSMLIAFEGDAASARDSLLRDVDRHTRLYERAEASKRDETSWPRS